MLHDWLLEPNARASIERAITSGASPTEAQLQAFEALFARAEDGAPRILSVAGGVARVDVSGVMTKRPSWIAQIFGGGNTTYADIKAAISAAESREDVKSIDLVFDTPGGSVDGMFEAMDVIRNASKPTRAVVASMAASAGYGLASQADKVVASGPSAVIGSVGVVARFLVDADVVTITSTEAPDKAPNVSTDEGRAVVQKHLDDLHALFVGGIAAGRGTTAAKVNKNFGRGAVFLAAEALENDMIDSISGENDADGTGPEALSADNITAEGGELTEVKKMTLAELKAQHPETYQAAVQEGVEQERDRVSAHLTYGKQCGAMDIATKAIEDGSAMTQSLTAKYMTAGMNKADIDARGGDDAELDSAAKPPAEPKADDDLTDAICAALGYVEEGGQ